MVSGNQTFVVRIPTAMYAEMVSHVVTGYPNEACGMLASTNGRVVKNYPTVNAAEHPDDFSEISPEDLLRIQLDIDEYDGDMYAYYHSHPRSEAYPSPRDIEWARRNGMISIIFSHILYPEQPFARAFLVAEDATVSEGHIIIE
jgi:proteasome lid subunit RPN8/RPN11